MTWQTRKRRVRRRMNRIIGLNIRGRADHEVYRVCDDVYEIVGKMLRVNEAIGPFSRHSRFDFQEVRFILELLGAPIGETNEEDYPVSRPLDIGRLSA